MKFETKEVGNVRIGYNRETGGVFVTIIDKVHYEFEDTEQALDWLTELQYTKTAMVLWEMINYKG